MATRTQVQNGSQGNDVKELQKILNQNGYGLTEDGIFGSKTEAAVRDYQKKQGLAVDGIVGTKTWGSLTGGAGKSPSTNNSTNNSFEYEDFSYGDYEASDTVEQAEAALNTQLANKPGEYQSQWQLQLDDTIKKILGREEFSYDLNGDALYQQYKDKYIQQGKLAMGDAIGQASAMTGGYGNSYAQSVGQQAYQAQLQNLNDIVPELYQMALDKYNQEGQDLYNQYAMLGEQENLDYGRYRDSVADYLTERDYLAGRYDSERDYDYGKYVDGRDFAYGAYSDDKSYAYQGYRDAIADEQWQKAYDYQVERDRISDEQWQKAFDAQYGNSSNGSNNTDGVNYTGNTGTTPGGNKYNNGTLTSSKVEALQRALGVEVDGMYGPKTKEAAGGLSADEAYKKFVGGTPGNNPTGSGFTGSTYNEAVEYMKSKGVPSANASGVMTREEWARRKSSYQLYGQGGTEVKNYSSYKEYLNDYIEYAIEKYS